MSLGLVNYMFLLSPWFLWRVDYCLCIRNQVEKINQIQLNDLIIWFQLNVVILVNNNITKILLFVFSFSSQICVTVLLKWLLCCHSSFHVMMPLFLLSVQPSMAVGKCSKRFSSWFKIVTVRRLEWESLLLRMSVVHHVTWSTVPPKGTYQLRLVRPFFNYAV